MTPRTPAREALLRAEYPHSTDPEAFLAKLNALDGPLISSGQAVRSWASTLGVAKTDATRAAIASERRLRTIQSQDLSLPRGAFVTAAPLPPDLTPQQQAEIADAAVDRKYASARRMIRARKPAAVVAHTTGLKLREVLRLAGEVRMGVGS